MNNEKQSAPFCLGRVAAVRSDSHGTSGSFRFPGMTLAPTPLPLRHIVQRHQPPLHYISTDICLGLHRGFACACVCGRLCSCVAHVCVYSAGTGADLYSVSNWKIPDCHAGNVIILFIACCFARTAQLKKREGSVCACACVCVCA